MLTLLGFLAVSYLSGVVSYRLLVLFVRRRRRMSPITEIHVEDVQDDYTFSKLKNYCVEHPSVTLMLMVGRWTRDEIKRIMGRYQELQSLGNKIGLHTHLAMKGELPRLNFKEQYDLIKEGKIALKDYLGVDVEDFVAGWWSFNEDTLQVLRELDIKRVHIPHIFTKEANLIREYGLEPIKVTRYLHDWNL